MTSILRDFEAMVVKYSALSRLSHRLKQRQMTQEITALDVRVDAVAHGMKRVIVMQEAQTTKSSTRHRRVSVPAPRRWQALPSESQDIPTLLRLLVEGSDAQVRTNAIRQLRHRAIRDKREILEVGGVQVLVDVLQRDNGDLQTECAATLRNLALASVPIKAEIARAGGIEALVQLARDGTDDQKGHASAVLWSLAFDHATRDAIAACGGLEVLVELLRSGTNEQAENALRALRELVRVGEHATHLRQLGGVNTLIECVRGGPPTETELAIELLTALVATDEESKTSVVNARGVRVLLEVLRVGASRHKERSVHVLNTLASGSPDLRAAFVREGGIAMFADLVHDTNNNLKMGSSAVLDELTEDPPHAATIKEVGDQELASQAYSEVPAKQSALFVTKDTSTPSVVISQLIQQLSTRVGQEKTVAVATLSTLFVENQ